MNAEKPQTDPVATLLGRLESLLDAYWPAAVSGDLKSAEMVRRILQQQFDAYGRPGVATASDDGDDELAKLRARRAGA